MLPVARLHLYCVAVLLHGIVMGANTGLWMSGLELSSDMWESMGDQAILNSEAMGEQAIRNSEAMGDQAILNSGAT